MTAQQLNTILFWTIMAIVGFSAWLLYSAQKFGARLARKEKSSKTTSSLRGALATCLPAGRRGNLKPKRKEAK